MSSRAEIVDYYLERSAEPGFEIDQIRKELVAKDVPEAEVRVIVRLVDSDLQHRALAGAKKDHSKQVVVAGIILSIVGLGITIGSFLGWIPSGDSVVIVYGPFFGGIVVIFTGLSMRSNGSSGDERISRSIKRPL